MKPIKMTEQDMLQWKAVYPVLNEQQLYEVFLGEKEGVDFNSYAQQQLSPEEMKAQREQLLLQKAKNTTAFECRYFNAGAKHFSGFYNASELLLVHLLNEDIPGVSYRDIRRWAGTDGVLQGKLNRILSYLDNKRELVDLSESADTFLPEELKQIVLGFTFEKDDTCLWFYPNLECRADIFKTFGKNGQSKEKGLTLTKDSSFAFRDVMCGYQESYFSVGITTSDFSFSLAVLPNNTATKACARVELVFCTEQTIYIDDANKYIDTSLLTAGLKS